MHVVPWILLKFYSGIFRLFRIVKNRKFRESVVTAHAESIFTVYGKMFSLCVCNSATDLLHFYVRDSLMILGAQVHRMRNSIGLCCTCNNIFSSESFFLSPFTSQPPRGTSDGCVFSFIAYIGTIHN